MKTNKVENNSSTNQIYRMLIFHSCRLLKFPSSGQRHIVLILLLLLTKLIFAQIELYGLGVPAEELPVDSAKLKYENYEYSEKVINIFKSADCNRNGNISLNELQIFQNWLVRSYSYKENEKALTPDEFLVQKGGDCEDFAIMTCCMLNYFGHTAFIASYGRVTVNKHALCLLKINTPVPPGCIYYELNGYWAPKGTYIPIDYELIGGLKAIDRRWKIASIHKPKDIFGKYF